MVVVNDLLHVGQVCGGTVAGAGAGVAWSVIVVLVGRRVESVWGCWLVEVLILAIYQQSELYPP